MMVLERSIKFDEVLASTATSANNWLLYVGWMIMDGRQFTPQQNHLSIVIGKKVALFRYIDNLCFEQIGFHSLEIQQRGIRSYIVSSSFENEITSSTGGFGEDTPNQTLIKTIAVKIYKHLLLLLVPLVQWTTRWTKYFAHIDRAAVIIL